MVDARKATPMASFDNMATGVKESRAIANETKIKEREARERHLFIRVSMTNAKLAFGLGSKTHRDMDGNGVARDISKHEKP